MRDKSQLENNIKMTDVYSKKKRSKIMSMVKEKDTKPEKVVRSLIHSLGYRYRLHRKDLPGKPDIVFKKYKKVIFVHGCFWHDHQCDRGKRIPKSNTQYWLDKKRKNRIREKKNIKLLKSMGWDCLIIWECEIKNLGEIQSRITSFLDNSIL